MNIKSAAIAAFLVTATAGSVAFAATPLYATPDAAAAACGTDEVVWVDLDRGKFYHKSQDKFAKGNNGGYACAKAAHSQYRESHD